MIGRSGDERQAVAIARVNATAFRLDKDAEAAEIVNPVQHLTRKRRRGIESDPLGDEITIQFGNDGGYL